ncbi:MAG: succinate dehydrogenase, cytochrome b556 subunit [Beijerinckiaceae bacterium]
MAETRAPVARPLSPHLQIYRWTWTMAMSIAHRVTGAALYAGSLLLAAWLIAAAFGPASYERAQWLAGSWLGRLALFGYTYALFHHMVGGVRHFIWDAGRGFEPEARMNLARMTPFVAGALTILAWIVGYAAR